VDVLGGVFRFVGDVWLRLIPLSQVDQL
jgi:hypothetical protein